MVAVRKEGSEDTLPWDPLTLDFSMYLRLVAHNLTQSHKTENKPLTYTCYCQKPLPPPLMQIKLLSKNQLF